MGEDVALASFTRDDNARHRVKVRRCLDAFALMLDQGGFDSHHAMTGLEIELDLVDAAAGPAMCGPEVLANLADPTFQPELGLFNLEFNARPRLIAGGGLADYEQDLLESLKRAGDRAARVNARLLQIGILPTLTADHAVVDSLSPNPRYRLLNEQILNSRTEHVSLDIRGPERLRVTTDSIAPEAAGTSVQFHLQVAPESFAAYWNASQAIAGVQVALGANSPFLFGRRLWDETRIVLFEQSTDTRPEELRAQGVRPRAWFGERWISSILDLFQENVRYFPPLLPICEEEDPVDVLNAGGVPRLGELRLHNGTIYRWNRPVYDVMNGRPHLRVENRVLPSGPTVADLLANGAFYFGLTRRLAEEERPVWSRLTFAAAEENFHTAARRGIRASLFWPQYGEIPATRLVLERLLPMAHEGLDRYGVDPSLRDRFLGIIERRCASRRNGASWQVETVRAAEARGLDRPAALREMVRRYLEYQQSGEPVHTWPFPG